MESSDLAGILDSNGRLLDLYGLKKSVFYRVRSHVTLPDTAPWALPWMRMLWPLRGPRGHAARGQDAAGVAVGVTRDVLSYA